MRQGRDQSDIIGNRDDIGSHDQRGSHFPRIVLGCAPKLTYQGTAFPEIVPTESIWYKEFWMVCCQCTKEETQMTNTPQNQIFSAGYNPLLSTVFGYNILSADPDKFSVKIKSKMTENVHNGIIL